MLLATVCLLWDWKRCTFRRHSRKCVSPLCCTEVGIARPIFVGSEDHLAVVPSLGDMLCNAGDDYVRTAGVGPAGTDQQRLKWHRFSLPATPGFRQLYGQEVRRLEGDMHEPVKLKEHETPGPLWSRNLAVCQGRTRSNPIVPGKLLAN